MNTTVNLGTIETTLVTDNPRLFEAKVAPLVTVLVPGAKFSWKFKKGDWDGKVSLVKQNDNHFTVLTGLVPKILDSLKGTGITVRDFRGLTTPTINKSTKVKARPYQYKAVTSALSSSLPDGSWFPRGIIKIPTGGGKTETAVMLYEMNPVPTMFVVHRKDLMAQAISRYETYGYKPGQIGDGVFKPDLNLTVATAQTLNRIRSGKDAKKRKLLQDLFDNCEQVYFDEAHIVASDLDRGNVFVNLTREFSNANCRWGLTATPFMRDVYSNLLLEGVTGPLLFDISSEDLISLGYLTPPKVYLLKVQGKLQVTKPRQRTNAAAGQYWRDIFEKGIKYHAGRNQMIADELRKGSGPTICLVTTIEQGKYIQTLTGPGVPLLDGSDDLAARKKAIADLRSGKIRAMIVTTIFDEGVDIPELRKIILGSGGKSPGKVLQRMGRGMRLATGKKEVEIIDFNDAHHPMLEKHTAARRAVYKAEGFL